MKLKTLLLVLAALSTLPAAAQFSMNTVGENRQLSVPMPVEVAPLDFHVVNAAEARVLKKQLWRSRNDVDFRVSATGMVTQFNRSWVKNNQNAVSSELAAYYYHTYTRGRHTSLFKFDAIYGMNYIDDVWFKNQDMLKLYYLSSWKLKQSGFLRNWAYSFTASFASQFAEGYKSRTEKTLWSNFMAPGTVNAGVGLTYTSPDPKWPFIVTLNPISANGLFVLDDRIGDDQRVKLGLAQPRDADGKLIRHKIEGGSSVNVGFNRTFRFGKKDGVTLQYNSTFGSFYGWMTEAARHDGIEGSDVGILPTVNWTNSFIFNPLRFLAIEFRTSTLYDRSQIDKVQMQYYLRVGLTYRYRNR